MATFTAYKKFDYKFASSFERNAFNVDTSISDEGSRFVVSDDWLSMSGSGVNLTKNLEGALQGYATSLSVSEGFETFYELNGFSFDLSRSSVGWSGGGYTVDGLTLRGMAADLSDILSGNDTLIGSEQSDRLAGFAGNDEIFGKAGNDCIEGWSGDDILDGGAGNDLINGGAGKDWIRGGVGNDTLNGGEGIDWLDYRDAKSSIVANLLTGKSSGGDGVDKFSGFEYVRGSAFNDTLTGDLGNNFLRGGKGNDVIDGGAGRDWADYLNASGSIKVDLLAGKSSGADGSDTLKNIENIRGGSYSDTLKGNADANWLRGESGNDFLDGGAGYDWADYWGASAAVTVNLANGLASGGAGSDTLKNIEGIRGSDYADTLTGDAGDNWIRGGVGNDILDGAEGNDRADYLDATSGVEVNLSLGLSAGPDGVDTLSNIEGVRGSSYSDYLVGNSGYNWLQGGLGNDTLDGGAGDNWADYWEATGSVEVNLVTGISSGADGNDTLININRVRGGDFADILIGDSRDNWLRGHQGNDTIDGGDGWDWADYIDSTGSVGVNLTTNRSSGAEGVDSLKDIECVRGSGYGDTLIGNSASNALNGALGSDTLTGGSGADFFLFDTGLDASKNLDTISDFAVGLDKIVLDDDVFTRLSGSVSGVALSAENFVKNTKAIDSDDFLIYNSVDHKLYYDADGSGSGAAIAFAKVELIGNAVNLEFSDLTVIA